MKQHVTATVNGDPVEFLSDPGMTLLDVPIYNQYIVRGMLIFAAVLINRIQIPKTGGAA